MATRGLGFLFGAWSDMARLRLPVPVLVWSRSTFELRGGAFKALLAAIMLLLLYDAFLPNYLDFGCHRLVGLSIHTGSHFSAADLVIAGKNFVPRQYNADHFLYET
jgi:hypothetical protein